MDNNKLILGKTPQMLSSLQVVKLQIYMIPKDSSSMMMLQEKQLDQGWDKIQETQSEGLTASKCPKEPQKISNLEETPDLVKLNSINVAV